MIKKRKIDNYHTYRAKVWAKQDQEDLKAEAKRGVTNGSPNTLLNPKKNVFLKDIWYCQNPAKAKELIADIVEYPEITNIELKQRWVYVQFDSPKEAWRLPGQPEDERKIYQGR